MAGQGDETRPARQCASENLEEANPTAAAADDRDRAARLAERNTQESRRITFDRCASYHQAGSQFTYRPSAKTALLVIWKTTGGLRWRKRHTTVRQEQSCEGTEIP